MEKPQKIFISHEEMERLKKIWGARGFKIPDKKKYQKGMKVIQSGKSKHTTENPCNICGETNWMLLPDSRKYCLKCGGVDTDKKPTHEPPKIEPKEIEDFELVSTTTPSTKTKKQKIEEITDFVLGR